MLCPFCGYEIKEDRPFGRNVVCDGCGDLIAIDSLVQEEVEYEVEVPDCFKFWDPCEQSCKKCPVGELCEDELEQKRPYCYGEKDTDIECICCLIASACADATESKYKESKMAQKVRIKGKRKPAQRRKVAPAKPAPVVETVVEEEELEEEEGLDPASYSLKSTSITMLRAELEARELTTAGRRSVLIKRLLADDAAGEEEELEEEVEEPTPAPKRRRGRAAVKGEARKRKAVPTKRAPRRVPKPAPVVEEPEEEAFDEDPIEYLIALLEEGKSLTITRAGEDQWIVSQGAPVAVVTKSGRSANGVRGKAFEEEAFTPEFMQFIYDDVSGNGVGWTTMTPDERYAMAEELEVSWNEHENSKTDAMRMGQAVRESLGVEKWKSQYQSRAARKALRDEGIRVS